MLRLGIAGIGAIAGDYIGLIVGGKVRDVALTALCSRNEAHIREAAQRHGLQAAAFTDYGAMLRSGQVDAILICTPHAQHPEMTRQALEAGLHVLVEKPVGIFADEVTKTARGLWASRPLKSAARPSWYPCGMPKSASNATSAPSPAPMPPSVRACSVPRKPSPRQRPSSIVPAVSRRASNSTWPFPSLTAPAAECAWASARPSKRP